MLQVANMLYVEAPSVTGFSLDVDGITAPTNDEQVLHLHYKIITQY